jgi:hypothetical protein
MFQLSFRNQATMITGFIVLAAVVGLAGCNPTKPGMTTTYGTIGWGSESEAEGIDGVDRALTAWYLQNRQLVYLLWTDLNGGGGLSAGGAGSNGEYDGELKTAQGETLLYRHKVSESFDSAEPDGQLIIGDNRYPLRDGTLILVDTVPELRVRQIKVPESVVKLLSHTDLPSDEIRSALRAVATDHEEIRQFFESSLPQESEATSQGKASEQSPRLEEAAPLTWVQCWDASLLTSLPITA